MQSKNQNITRGELAKITGINLASIRFYERQNLLILPHKNSSGYYMYQHSDVKRIHFIQRAQTLGFSLKEIKLLLELSVSPGHNCADVQLQAETKLADVQSKIYDLLKMQTTLKKLIESCKSRKTTGDCPLIDSLTD